MSKWEMVRLGDVLRVDKTTITPIDAQMKPYIGLEHITKNTGEIEKGRENYREEIKSSKFAFDKRHILYGKLRPNLNKVALPDFSGVCSTDIYPLLINEKTADRRLICAILRRNNFVTYATSQVQGVNLPRVNEKIITNYKIPLPPLDIQHKIAAVLDKVSEILTLRKRQLTELDNLVKSRFIEMFGDPVSNPMGWDSVAIRDVTDVQTGATPKAGTPKYYKDGVVPWVTTSEVNGYITQAESYITPLALKETNCKVFPENTVLVAMYGQGKTRGKSGLLKFEAATNQACAAILPSDSFVPLFLYELFHMEYEELRSLGRGGNQPNLNLSLVKDFPVIKPPLDLQNRFADFVRQTDKSKSAIQKSLSETQLLFDSLMSRYFD